VLDAKPLRSVRRATVAGVVCAAVVVLGTGAYWLRMQHVIHFRNTRTTEAIKIGMSLDNQPSFYRELDLAPGGTATIRFHANAEAGYIFYQLGPAGRVEIGRCGYTDKRVNEYMVEVGNGRITRCTEMSSGGPFPLP
jgi:hypothetical protein